MNLQLLAFVLYLCLMLGIGLYFFVKSNKSKADGDKEYFLGGRQMGPYVTAMSAQASDMSGWLLMGFPGSIMAFGFGQIWIGIGLALGTIANWIFVARRLRKFSEAANDAITLPQYLSNRFATKSKVLQIICAIIFLVFFTLYVASSFNAGAQVLLDVVPQLNGNMSLAVLIFAVIIIIYTFFGGFKAVCWTDFFQGLMMLVAIMAVPIVLLATKNVDTSVLSIPVGDYSFATTPFSVKWQDIASGLAWGLGYFGMPHILVRFMSIKKPSMMKK
ncbi:MAG: sodium:proline symporter, partial [Clostridia bacterium]|nr:sodium:proline symporter [Clostridia bacterium]